MNEIETQVAKIHTLLGQLEYAHGPAITALTEIAEAAQEIAVLAEDYASRAESAMYEIEEMEESVSSDDIEEAISLQDLED